jgi:hypothetical protein
MSRCIDLLLNLAGDLGLLLVNLEQIISPFFVGL